jgi:hypothetical protein
MESDLVRRRVKAILLFWKLLLVPWLLLAPLSGMAFDAGPTRGHLFMWFFWTYPVSVLISAVFKEVVPAIVALPLVNVIAVFLV